MNINGNIIENRIQALICEFKNTPEKFLTEEDLRSYFYHLLMRNFNKEEECEDGTKSTPVHCEVRWYGSSGRLKLRSDIVIIDISSLKTKDKGGFRLPSKGYSFNKFKILIEIKLRRRNSSESDTSFKKKIENDRKKVLSIRAELTFNFYSYLLIFDKKNYLNISLENTAFSKEYYIYPY